MKIIVNNSQNNNRILIISLITSCITLSYMENKITTVQVDERWVD